jgi:hypothetical protein
MLAGHSATFSDHLSLNALKRSTTEHKVPAYEVLKSLKTPKDREGTISKISVNHTIKYNS